MISDLKQLHSLSLDSNRYQQFKMLLVIDLIKISLKVCHQESRLLFLLQVFLVQLLLLWVLLLSVILLPFIRLQFYFLSSLLQLQEVLLSSKHLQQAFQQFLLYEHLMMVLFHDNLCVMVVCPLEKEQLFLYLYIQMVHPKVVSFIK